MRTHTKTQPNKHKTRKIQKSTQGLWGNMKTSNICIIEIPPKEVENGATDTLQSKRPNILLINEIPNYSSKKFTEHQERQVNTQAVDSKRKKLLR